MMVRAWYTSDMSSAYKKEKMKVVLGETHHQVPVIMIPESSVTHKILAQAFEFFNWVYCDFVAPKEVNEFARRTGTHASMSVGDVVEIQSDYGHSTLYVCKPVGWEFVRTQEA